MTRCSAVSDETGRPADVALNAVADRSLRPTSVSADAARRIEPIVRETLMLMRPDDPDRKVFERLYGFARSRAIAAADCG